VCILKWTTYWEYSAKQVLRTAVTSCCQVHTLNAHAHMPICGAAMLLYVPLVPKLRCCSMHSALNCAPLSTLRMGITLVLVPLYGYVFAWLETTLSLLCKQSSFLVYLKQFRLRCVCKKRRHDIEIIWKNNSKKLLRSEKTYHSSYQSFIKHKVFQVLSKS